MKINFSNRNLLVMSLAICLLPIACSSALTTHPQASPSITADIYSNGSSS